MSYGHLNHPIFLPIIFLPFFFHAGFCYAGIDYFAEGNIIRVSDFTRDNPATLSHLKAADAQNGWGRVEVAPATHATTVRAHLQIGGEGIADTHFQIGTKDHPKEMLILAGKLTLLSPADKNQATVLQLGNPADKSITPTLKMDFTAKEGYSIYTFARTRFNAYHATITSARPGKDHRVTGVRLSGMTDWQECRVSWFQNPTYRSSGGIFKRITFSHCGWVFIGPSLNDVEDCVVKDSDFGLRASGHGYGVYRRCIFENNLVNLQMGHGGQAVLIDPLLKPARSSSARVGNILYKGKLREGRITVKRSMFVEVVDAEDNPVQAALVDVTNEAPDGPAPENGATATDEDGRTPDRYSDPVTVVEYIQTAAEGKDGIENWAGVAPITKSYTYQVIVRKDGYADSVTRNVAPDPSWLDRNMTLRVVLGEPNQ
jgi:hypothetical protein